MRVLIVSSNRLRQPVAVFPFGACLVAQAAQRAGHEARFLDLMFERRPERALAAALADWRADVVGLAIRNIDSNDAANPLVLTDEAAALAACIRKHSRAKLVLGGAALGVMPRELLARTGADWAVITDGEAVFPELLAALAAGKDPAGIPGVFGRDHSQGADAFLPLSLGRGRPAGPGEGAPFEDEGRHHLTDCAVEDLRQWVDVRAYLSRMAAVPVQSKRGCPFECVYCTYNIAEGRGYRLHPPQRVVESIARLAGQGFRDIEFVDNVFNSPYEHGLEICRQLSAARPPVRLQSLELNPRFLDDELLAAMESAGFAGIGLTVESAADEVLAALRKGYTAADVHRAAEVVNRHRLPCLWIFMLGGPGETQATVRQTLDFAARRIRPGDTAFFQVGVRIYPSTPLEELARAENLLSATREQMLAPIFYHSPQAPLDWLRRELAEAASNHMNFLAGDSLGLPLLQKVLRLSHLVGLRPPLWRHTPKLRRLLDWLGLYRP